MKFVCLFVCLMVFNATFNNISVISWRSVLLVEETGGPGENHRPAESYWQTLSRNAVHLDLIEIRTHNFLVVIGTDCQGNTITATTAAYFKYFKSNWDVLLRQNTYKALYTKIRLCMYCFKGKKLNYLRI